MLTVEPIGSGDPAVRRLTRMHRVRFMTTAGDLGDPVKIICLSGVRSGKASVWRNAVVRWPCGLEKEVLLRSDDFEIGRWGFA